MNKKERVLAALRKEPVDRIPVSFWRHFSGEDAQGARCVEQHVAFYRATNLDFVKIMHDGFTAPCNLDVHCLGDLRRYRPLGRENPYIIGWLDRAKRVNDFLSGEVYTYANIFAPFTLLRRIGDERLRYYIREDEATVRAALDALGEDLALLSQLLVEEAGCLGIFAAFQGAEVSRFSPEAFDRIVRPYDRKFLDAANGASEYNILHFCGWDEIKNRLESWQDYPGRAVNWATYVEEMNLAEGQAYFGNRTVLGGFDNRRHRVLYEGSEQQVRAETRRLVETYLRATGETTGLMIGGDCSYLSDFALERFCWVAEEIKNLTIGKDDIS